MHMAGSAMHYLEKELKELISRDERIFTFLESVFFDGLWYRDLQHPDQEWVNDRFWHELGFDRSDPSIEQRQSYVHPDDLPHESAALQAHIENPNKPFDIVVRYIHKDQSIVWFHCRGMTITSLNQSAPRMLVAFQNISPLKRAEQQLLIEKERYEVAINGASVGIWDWEDVTTDRVFWNKQFYNLLGYQEHEFKSDFSAFESRLHPDDKARTLDAVEKHLKDKEPYDIEYRLKTKSGEYRWFHAVGNALRDELGIPYRMAGSIEDVHEKQLAKQESLKLLSQLTESNKDLEQFAYAASHDLQEPLRIISSYIGLIKRKHVQALNEEAKEFFAIVEDGCGRMKSLILDLLSYSRIKRSGEIFEVVNVGRLIEKLVDGFKSENPGTNINVEIEGDTEIEAIKSYMDRLLSNLLSNAVKYQDPDRPLEIKISARSENQFVIISIKDNGIGIEREYFKRIFEVFQRLHTITEYPGTGIGLAICKRIVEIHEGSISVDSIFGQGSTFIVRIPQFVQREG